MYRNLDVYQDDSTQSSSSSRYTYRMSLVCMEKIGETRQVFLLQKGLTYSKRFEKVWCYMKNKLADPFFFQFRLLYKVCTYLHVISSTIANESARKINFVLHANICVSDIKTNQFNIIYCKNMPNTKSIYLYFSFSKSIISR